MKLYGKTDVGKRRKNNQDSFVIRQDAQHGIALGLVCDGMGGVNGGNIASVLACEAFLAHVEEFLSSDKMKNGCATEGDISSMLAHAVANANSSVYQRAAREKALAGMGTTLVAALVIHDVLYAVNVGDSRLYLYANGALTQITKDHSLVQYLLDTGKITKAEAQNYPSRNVITRAIGTERGIEADIFSVDLHEVSDDSHACALLCSDGLSSYVAKDDIIAVFQQKQDVAQMTETLIHAANEAGGVDNVTVVLMALGTGSNAEPETEKDGADGSL